MHSCGIVGSEAAYSFLWPAVYKAPGYELQRIIPCFWRHHTSPQCNVLRVREGHHTRPQCDVLRVRHGAGSLHSLGTQRKLRLTKLRPNSDCGLRKLLGFI